MKMEFAKLTTTVAVLLTLSMSAPRCFAADVSMDGNSLAGEKLTTVGEFNATTEVSSLEGVQSGRALLKAEDFRRLVGLNGKAPANEKPSVSKEGIFSLEFSNRELSSIRNRIFQIERDRETLYAKILKENEIKKMEIRLKRRDIQSQRISAKVTDDLRISKILYENILQEANLDAQIKIQLENFDRSHLVSIDFTQAKGQRIVQSISIGPNAVWALKNQMSIAKK
jgi:hypothetical protein